MIDFYNQTVHTKYIESEVVYLPESTKSPQSNCSCCSFGKIYFASFLGSLTSMFVAIVISVVFASVLGAVIAQKVGGSMLNGTSPSGSSSTEDINWDQYFKEQQGTTSTEAKDYVNPFENL